MLLQKAAGSARKIAADIAAGKTEEAKELASVMAKGIEAGIIVVVELAGTPLTAEQVVELEAKNTPSSMIGDGLSVNTPTAGNA